MSAVFLGATASGSEIEPGTIEYLWTRPRTRASVTWTHWSVCAAEMVAVAVVPIYLAAVLLATLTKHWDFPFLFFAPGVILVLRLPVPQLPPPMPPLPRIPTRC